MARIFMEGFENGAINIQTAATEVTGKYGIWDKVSGRFEYYTGKMIPSTTTPNNSVYSLLWDFYYTVRPNQAYMYKDLPSSYSKLFLKFDINIENSAGHYPHIFKFYDSGLSERVRVSIGNGPHPNLYLYVGGSLVVTVTDAFHLNHWYRFEMMYDNTSGAITIKLDGATIVTYSGTLGGTVSRFQLGNELWSGAMLPAYKYYMDNVIINDDTGSVNNSWVGYTEIVMLKPNGAGAHSDFTASAGDAYACVDDQPFENTTDYIESSTPNNISTFTMEDLPAGTPTINAAQVETYSIYSDTDVTNSKTVLRVSGTNYLGSEQIEDNVKHHVYETLYELNPNTSTAWTKTAIDGVEVGIQHIENV